MAGMKRQLATVLSVAGVLAAGSAAALVNTRALSGSGNGGDAAAAAALGVPGSAPTEVTAAPSSNTPTSSTPPVATSPVVTTRSVFTVGDAGVVTVDRAHDTLMLVSARPAGGWQLVKAEPTSSVEVEVVFRSSSIEVTFRADLLDGRVTTSVDARELSRGTTSTPSVAAPASGPRSSDDGHESEPSDHESDHGGGDD